MPFKARRTTTACVHAPKLHFTRVSSNPIARFGLGVETKSEFPTFAPGPELELASVTDHGRAAGQLPLIIDLRFPDE
jgi:hypothetical protein